MDRFLKAFISLESLAKPANAGAAMAGAVIVHWLEQAIHSEKLWIFLLFVAVIAADWVAGTAAAKKSNTYSSEYEIEGLLRTVLLLWIPFIGWLLDKVALTTLDFEQPGYAFFSLTAALIYHSWESMTANAYRAGWEKWIPKPVVSYVSSEIKAKTDRALEQKGVEKL
ncbi:holin [Paenibacillus sp. LMG 31456]|uniref:Holin n=1 Tax=Paenibacillus foliorum TaxID=2654974 RepID=A0A972GKJ0_9BACL|nr:phage holin family protein [Paenibacillus foliorum]NOU92023.1 holin [Paenibacillus foliorum]